MIKVIDFAIEEGTEDDISNLEMKIKRKFLEAKDRLKYIPDAWKNYNILMNMDKWLHQKSNRDDTPINTIAKLKKYREVLVALKQSIVSANHQIVNVNDLFQSVGFVKNITKMAFSEYQNGWLAFRQTHVEKRLNTVLLIVSIIVGVFVLISIYVSYSQNTQIKEIQDLLVVNSAKIDHMYSFNKDVNIIDINSSGVNQNIHPLNSDISSNDSGGN